MIFARAQCAQIGQVRAYANFVIRVKLVLTARICYFGFECMLAVQLSGDDLHDVTDVWMCSCRGGGGQKGDLG